MQSCQSAAFTGSRRGDRLRRAPRFRATYSSNACRGPRPRSRRRARGAVPQELEPVDCAMRFVGRPGTGPGVEGGEPRAWLALYSAMPAYFFPARTPGTRLERRREADEARLRTSRTNSSRRRAASAPPARGGRGRPRRSWRDGAVRSLYALISAVYVGRGSGPEVTVGFQDAIPRPGGRPKTGNAPISPSRSGSWRKMWGRGPQSFRSTT